MSFEDDVVDGGLETVSLWLRTLLTRTVYWLFVSKVALITERDPSLRGSGPHTQGRDLDRRRRRRR